MSNPQALVQKLWNYCDILRDDGLSYGDYVEQLTLLLFLKMADEQSRAPYDKSSVVPAEYAWPTLISRSGDALEVHYRHALEELGKRGGMLGLIFRKAQNKIQDPAKLQRLIVDLIDREQWTSLSTDVKGDAYEGLLQKNAKDVKGGAGQRAVRRRRGGNGAPQAPSSGRRPHAPAPTPEGRWREYRYEELSARDKANLDITWLRDSSLEDSANLPDPDVIAAEIVEDLQAALEQFALIANLESVGE